MLLWLLGRAARCLRDDFGAVLRTSDNVAANALERSQGCARIRFFCLLERSLTVFIFICDSALAGGQLCLARRIALRDSVAGHVHMCVLHTAK